MHQLAPRRRGLFLTTLAMALAVVLALTLHTQFRASAEGSKPRGSAASGQLEVCGTQLCDAGGEPVQLRGMSTHGTQWYADCVTEGSLDALAYDWGADVLRVSTYVQEGGYESDPAGSTCSGDEWDGTGVLKEAGVWIRERVG